MFSAHPDKIYVIRFHPTAADILTTAAHDLTVKIWNLSEHEPVCSITLQGNCLPTEDSIYTIKLE